MPQPKRGNGWAELSSTFEEAGKRIARKRQKRENLDEEKMFLKPKLVGSKRADNICSLSRLIEACEPKKVSDLSVSKQKQKEIGDWFTRDCHSGKPRILVISGPSGCGKTSALKIISSENGYDFIEWTTPTDSLAFETYTRSGQSDKFLDFLIRATRYNSIFQKNSRRFLLVKDIPNVYLIKHDLFRILLENYFQYGKEPLVFVCTDGESSKMLKILFPSELREHFNIDHISVNSITQTAMKNMIKRVSVILNSQGRPIIDIKQRNIDEVLSNSIGDVRSTILNLIFNSLKVADNKLKHDCGSREETLGLLHGVGRVINPKRIQCGDILKFVHDPDEIASYFHSQSSTFLYFLHENYMNTMPGIEEIDLCADVMSLSDMIISEWRDPSLTKLNLSFYIRGIMVINKNPVSGWNPVRKPRSEEIKVSRSLAAAEERWYESIICPRDNHDFFNLDNTIIEQNSD